MKIGMNLLLWTATAKEEHVPLFRQIKGWGFDGVEIPMFDPGASPWKNLATALDGIGLGRTAVVVVPPTASPVSPDARIRASAVDFLKRTLDAARTLGVETLAGPVCAPVGELTGRPRTADEWKWCVETLQPVAAHAQATGVTLAVEFLNRFETYFLNCTADACKLVGELNVPGTGILYDTFHAHIEEKNVDAAIRGAGKHIAHVHISENDRSTPGEGQVRWKETFAALKAIGYDKWFVVEAFGQALPELAGATKIWRQMFPTADHLATKAQQFARDCWAKA